MIFMRHVRRNALKVEGERSSALDLARGRLVLMGGFFILAYVMLVVRAFDLSVIQSMDFGGNADAPIEVVKRDKPAEIPRRADIFDRNGELLATTLKSAALFVDPYLVSDAPKAAAGLAKIFPDISYGTLLQKLQSKRRFEWINRKVTPDQQQAVLRLGEPGLEFEETYQRFYPQGALATHLIGYSNVDLKGLAGVERGFDKLLSESGDLHLTLDMRLQHILRREVASAVKEFKAIGAAGVIMDATNGDILAGVSLPDFNPHHPPGVSDKEAKEAMFSRLTQGDYELGSVFKIFSTAAFFETNDVPINVKFDARQPLKSGRYTINDYHAEDRVLTAPEVFMYSSNIGSALMGQAVGGERLKDFYEDLGLLTPLDFEVREVARPQVPNPWSELSTFTASYGHGLTTTPLQLAAGVASIVNGGYLVKPHLVMGAQENTSENIRVFSPKTAHRMRQLLRLVVTEGTGKKADVEGYRVGGKTGTAEKIVNGRYDDDKKISSFVGVFPMDDPKYVIYIMVDEPKGNKQTWGYATGGWVAAPAVQRVISSMASVLGLPPAAEDAPESQFGSDIKQYVSAKGKN